MLRASQFTVELLEQRTLLSLPPALFDAAQNFTNGGSFIAVAVADANHDGHPDIIAPQSGGGAGAVFLGNGDGTFHPGSTFLNPAFFNIVTADLNGDGRTDVVIDDETHSKFSVNFGNADGSFQAPQTVGFLPLEDSIAVADLNGDGHPDLLGGSGRNAGLQILLGNGDGTFKPQYSLSAGSQPFGIAAADFNGDGKMDIATGDFSGPVSILLGNGDGTFAPRTTLANGFTQLDMSAADLNNDGRIDLIACDEGTITNLQVYLGNGNGTFQPQVTYNANRSFQLNIADLNNDGKLDVAVGSASTGGGVCTLLGNGDGTFAPKTVSAPGMPPGPTVIADVNNDGRLDAVAGGQGVYIALGNPPPSVVSIDAPAATATYFPYSSDPTMDYVVTFSEPVTGVDPTDFQVVTTGTATANALVSVVGGPTLYTVIVSGIAGGQRVSGTLPPRATLGLNLVNDGTILDTAGQPLRTRSFVSFGPAKTFATPNLNSQIAAADLNGDGKIDIASANYNSATVSVALGNGDGTFTAQLTFAAGTHPVSVIAIDTNRDGHVDLVVSNQGINNLGVLLGNGDGTFSAQSTFATGNTPWTIVFADVNRDGIPDLLVANQNSNSLSVLLGNGNGTFKPQLTFATGAGPRRIAPADLNGDGRIDVAVPNRTANSVTILLGNGDGTFHAGPTLNTGTQLVAVFTGDLNGDGKPDLVASAAYSANVILGNGDGTFGPMSATIVINPTDIADMNNDGKLDLVGSSNAQAYVQLGNGDGTFGPAQVSAAPWSTAATVADVDRNGYPDLLTALAVSSESVGALLANDDGSFVGKTYNVVPYLNVTSIPAPYYDMIFARNPDGRHVDVIDARSYPIGQVLIDDPAGLTLKGGSQQGFIDLDYHYGSPIPRYFHIDGPFTFLPFNAPPSGLLAGTTLDVGHSIVSFGYTSAPAFATEVVPALKQGFNGGAWNGSPAGTIGSIISADAAADPTGVPSVGIANSSDAVVPGLPANTIELRYTIAGDANLDGVVDFTDAINMARHYLAPGATAWDAGNFNYDAAIDFGDATILQKNFGLSVPATPAVVPVPATAPDVAATPTLQPPVPPVTVTPATAPPDPQTPESNDDLKKPLLKPNPKRHVPEITSHHRDKKPAPTDKSKPRR